MYFPKLSPLQSRFAGSLVATLLLVLIYLSITNPQFAYAATGAEAFGHPRPDPLKQHIGEHRIEGGVVGWKGGIRADGHDPEFEGLDQGIRGRAPSGVTALTNNDPKQLNITPGEIQYWVVENSTITGPNAPPLRPLPLGGVARRKRRDGFDLEDESGPEFDEDFDTVEDLRIRQAGPGGARMLYITLNTCIQPSPNTSSNTQAPSSLKLYISTSSNNQRPGPNSTSSDQKVVDADGGYASYTMNATGDTYIGVLAPPAPSYQDVYNYEIAVSIDAQYHSYNDTDNLLLVDSDSSSTLLVTNSLPPLKTKPVDPIYQAWINLSPPYVIFAHDQNDPLIKGLQKSSCGLWKYAQIAAARDAGAVSMSMTTRVLGDQPKQQFHIGRLNKSSPYSVFLGMRGNSTKEGQGVVGGGGTVWKSKKIVTKSDGNCQIISDLNFCKEVAYAVPSNPDKVSDIASWYDAKAEKYYKNFTYSLQQIACNTTSSAQYSPVRSCEDCDAAYKRWLCAVTIPRCEDYSSNKTLFERNIRQGFANGSVLHFDYQSRLGYNNYTNGSRNPAIDGEIQPGPYKEILPCEDLCFSLVQSCPAVLQFNCPSGDDLYRSYGKRSNGDEVTCSSVGPSFHLSAGAIVVPTAMTRTTLLIFVGFWLWYSF